MKVILEHHYGEREHQTSAGNLTDAAKEAIRKTHHFLTDNNHSMTDLGNRIKVNRKDNPPNPRLTPAVFNEGPNGYWFSVRYRDPVKKGEG